MFSPSFFRFSFHSPPFLPIGTNDPEVPFTHHVYRTKTHIVLQRIVTTASECGNIGPCIMRLVGAEVVKSNLASSNNFATESLSQENILIPGDSKAANELNSGVPSRYVLFIMTVSKHEWLIRSTKTRNVPGVEALALRGGIR